jgi:hypothetical protein
LSRRTTSEEKLGSTVQSIAHIGIHIVTDEEGMESNTHKEDIESDLLNAPVDVDEDDPYDNLPLPSVLPLGLIQVGKPQSGVQHPPRSNLT